MDRPQIARLVLRTRDLAKTQEFYTAIGIAWLGGGPEVIGKSGLPLSVERCPPPYGGVPGLQTAGLPDLQGDFGEVELWFYLDPSLTVIESIPHVQIGFAVEEPERVLGTLKSLGFRVMANSTVVDPDGRHVDLWAGHSM